MSDDARDYEALGLVAGLEIHQQLDTETKLFCESPTELREPGEATHTITRELHPTRSELGELDEAAMEESRVDRTFEYLAYDTTCLVEEDDEPPARIDEEALQVAMSIADLLDADVVDQAHVMRKLVIDGSNTSGFQRSTLLAQNGEIETGPSLVWISPSCPRSIVRWNPEVFDPSTTIFRITWAWSTGVISSSVAISSVVSIASRSTRWGGSSSSSTRQVVS